MAIFGFIITIGAVQIVMRYTPGINSMSWVDEIMRYLNIWVIFLAAGIGVREGSHLQLEYFLRKIFPEKAIITVQRVSRFATVGALLLLIYFGTVRVLDNLHTVIQSLPLSISWFYAAIPIGSAMILMDYLLILTHSGKHPFAWAKAAQN